MLILEITVSYSSHIQTYHFNQDESLEELNPHGFPCLRIFHQKLPETGGVITSRCIPEPDQDTARLHAGMHAFVFWLTTAPSLSMEGTRGPANRAGKRAGNEQGTKGLLQ